VIPRDVLVFVGVLALFLAVVWMLSTAMVYRDPLLGALAITIIILLYVVWKTDALVELLEYQRAVVFRFGRFVGVRGPGWIFVIPFVETYKVVDTRVQTVDVPKQEVVTKDNIVLNVDAVIYLQVVDPEKAILKVDDYKEASRLFVQAMIRDLIGSMTLDEVIGKIDELNERLKVSLSKMADAWGVKVVSVQLTDIDIPPGLRKAMHQMMIAEKEKRARAERAEALKIELEAIKEAVKDMNEQVLLYFYIEAIKKLAEGRSTKIIYPLELSSLAEAIAQKIGFVSADRVRRDLEKYGDVIKKVLEKGGEGEKGD